MSVQVQKEKGVSVFQSGKPLKASVVRATIRKVRQERIARCWAENRDELVG
jgi:hypothetical protein